MRKFLLLLPFLLLSCSSDDSSGQTPDLYFPPVASDVWETTTPESLGWNTGALSDLLQYLELKHSKSFIMLVDGRIVVEAYFNGHTASTPWYWASAGKTLTATATGIAEQEGIIQITQPVSAYLGEGWTSAPPAKEQLITVRHLLTMTSGLDDDLGDSVDPANLQYLADAGTRWAYDNVYVKLQDVVAQASGTTWNQYFKTRIRDKIGMGGFWFDSGDDLSVYASDTRSMARFGLLMLNRGNWNGEMIVNSAFATDAMNTSQNLNKSYGYLWWLNGKSSFRLPQTQLEFPGPIVPSGPTDMVMALGRDDQKIYVVPSKRLVVVRMGEAADNLSPALSDFDDALWQKINAVLP